MVRYSQLDDVDEMVVVCSHEEFFEDLEAAIHETCVAIDKEFLDWCKTNRKYCGTTALGAFVLNSTLVVFNIGDSMAVMSSGGKAVSIFCKFLRFKRFHPCELII